ncbi:MAG: Hsp20/alpha crystallin family protein [Planctomycetota bacterium]
MYGSLCYQPAREFGLLREAVNELFSGASGAVHEFPPVNVYTNDNGAIVKAELPGVKLEELDITVANNTLTLRGNRGALDLKEEARTLRSERLRGQFARVLNLPFKVDATQSTAQFDKGTLTITLPRAESDKPRKIAIAAL